MALGVGASTFSGSGPNGSVSITGVGIPARLALGGTVAHGLVLGGAVSGAGAQLATSSSGIGSIKAQYAALTFFADLYPSASDGWHVGGDLGFGVVAIGDTSNDGGGNLVASISGGYDWWFADQWSFGAMLVAAGGSRTTLRDSSTNVDSGYQLGVASIGVLASFLYH